MNCSRGGFSSDSWLCCSPFALIAAHLSPLLPFIVSIYFYLGKGYGTETTTLLIRYGFLELNLNRIQTQDMEENIGGWRADEKAGFKYEGTLREAIPRFGTYHNIRVYSILRSEFVKQEQEQRQ